MDTQVDPCEDFNKFACGGFIKTKETQGKLDPLVIVGKEVGNQGRQLIEGPNLEDDPESYKMAKTFYKSCMDEKKLNDIGVKPLKDLFEKLGGWPILDSAWDEEKYTDIWEQSIEMKHEGISPQAEHEGISPDHFATIVIKPDAKNNSNRVLHFKAANLLGLAHSIQVKY